ncbi:MAG: (5-formylfuran-3-yl)methyl phosphate synthase, partial [Candidatus Hodarchaeota archaeon]
ASLGMNYVKIGVYGPKNLAEARCLLENVVKSVKRLDQGIQVVAAAYADHVRMQSSIPPMDLVKVAADCGCDYVMVDTFIKDEKRLVDFMSKEDIINFCNLAHDSGMKVALAGKLCDGDIPFIKTTNADVIGVRSMVCTNNDRESGTIDANLVKKLKENILTGHI